MTDPHDDEDIEAFLRRFEPRPPSPLPAARHASSRTWWTLAAASLAAGALWLGWPTPPPPPVPVAGETTLAPATPRSRPTLAELSVVLRPIESARVADELEERVLADPRRRGGALHEMASDGPGH